MRTPRSLLLLVVVVALVAWHSARDPGSAAQNPGIEREPATAGSVALAPDIVPINAGSERTVVLGSETSIEQATSVPVSAPQLTGESASIHGHARLLDGTPLGGFRVSAYTAGSSGASGSATTADDGSFIIGGLVEGIFEVRVQSHGALGSKQVGVFAPGHSIELRLDAVLVELSVKTDSLDRLEDVTWLTVSPFGVDELPFGGSSGGVSFDAEGVCRKLLPSGPAYLFSVTLPDKSTVMAMIERGLVSGVYREELVAWPSTMGRLRAVLSSGAVEMPDRIAIRFEPIPDSFFGAPPRFGPGITLRGAAGAEATTVALPGRYLVTVEVVDFPPLMYRRAVLSSTTVDLAAGGAATVNVDLEAAGRAIVTVLAKDLAGARELTLELFDEATSKWTQLSVMHLSGVDTVTSTRTLPFGVEAWTEQVLFLGPARLRLRAGGWVTIEQTLEIVPGEMTPWRAHPQPTN